MSDSFWYKNTYWTTIQCFNKLSSLKMFNDILWKEFFMPRHLAVLSWQNAFEHFIIYISFSLAEKFELYVPSCSRHYYEHMTNLETCNTKHNKIKSLPFQRLLDNIRTPGEMIYHILSFLYIFSMIFWKIIRKRKRI